MALSIEQMEYAVMAYEFLQEGHYLNYLNEIEGIHSCKKILDIGSGPGQWLLAVENLIDYDKLIASDISMDWLNFIKRNVNKIVSKKLPMVQLDAAFLPFKDNYFDLAISSLILPCVSNDKKICDEMVRVINYQGKGIILFHTYGYYLRRLMTKNLKIKIASLIGIISSFGYILTKSKIYNSTFQTHSFFKNYFRQNNCQILHYDADWNSGVGFISFIKKN